MLETHFMQPLVTSEAWYVIILLEAAQRLTAHSLRPSVPVHLPQVIVSLAEKGDMGALMAYTGQSGQSLNYMQLMQQLMMNNPNGAVSLAKMVAKQVRATPGWFSDCDCT